MKRFYTHSPAETEALAEKLCAQIGAGTAVAFTGTMGMGKTAFVRGALRAYRNPAFVSSPTFALVHDYGGTPRICHFDMYRVQSLDDLYSTGFFDYLRDDSILFIEWSEHIIDALPENTVFIDLQQGTGENDRIITVRGGVF